MPNYMIKKILKKTVRTLLWLVGIIITFIVIAIIFTKLDPVFGGTPDEQSQHKIEASKNFNGAIFVNMEETDMMHYKVDPKAWKGQKQGALGQLFPAGDKNPKAPLPSVKFDKKLFSAGNFAWLGHSTLIMNVDNQNIIIDPVFYKASPIFIGGKPFALKNPTTISDLPKIDFVLISHDHYDHLDAKALKEMKPLVKKYLVPLGIKAHLVKWGIESDKIMEFDWYESTIQQTINFIFTPSRHFSGRGILGRNTTLWGGWVIKGTTQNIYASGDSGYTKEFATIGEKYGPFDIAFLESGAYNSDWAQIHMFPEQSVQAGIDVKSNVLFPIHWGKFDLSLHHWKEPIVRFTKYAKEKQKEVATPFIGEIFDLEKLPRRHWWK